MAASKRANGVPSALVARQSLNDEELVRNCSCFIYLFVYLFIYYAFATRQCIIFSGCPSVRSFVRSLIRPFVRTNSVTTLSHDRLEQSRWNWHGIFHTHYVIWLDFGGQRSKVKVAAGRRVGEGIHRLGRRSPFLFYSLLLAHLMGQYCFAGWHLSSSVVVCDAAGVLAGRPPGAWTVGAPATGRVVSGARH